MIEYMFYAAAFPFILYEAYVLTKPMEMHLKIERLKDKKEATSDSEKLFVWMMFVYAVWCFAGLFSSQWVFFLIILILSIAPTRTAFLRALDAGITLAILLFIIINRFHLRMEVP